MHKCDSIFADVFSSYECKGYVPTSQAVYEREAAQDATVGFLIIFMPIILLICCIFDN